MKLYNKLQNSPLLLFIFILIFLHQPTIASDDIEKTGNIVTLLIPAIAYGTTFYTDDSEGRTQFYKSFATNLAITYGLKSIVDKKRPNGSDHSFPSGHTAITFQGAAFIHKRYGIKYSIPAYIGASFVGYSRVESDEHYTEDVVAGAVIGIISSFYFTRPYKDFIITPISNDRTYGIQITKRW